MRKSGGVSGRVVNTSNSGVQTSPVTLFPYTRNFTPPCLSSPRCIKLMGTGDIPLGGNLGWTTVVFHPGGSSNTPKHASC